MKQQTATTGKELVPFQPLSLESLKGAKDVATVDQFKAMFVKDTAVDLQRKKEAAQQTEAAVALLTASRGLGKAINEILSENDDLQKKWTEIMAEIASGSPEAQTSLTRKVAGLGIPFFSGMAQKRIDGKLDQNILRELPNLLKAQLYITQKAADRIRAQIVILKQSEIEAEKSYEELGESMIRLRKENRERKEEFDVRRNELARIEAILKENGDLEKILDEGQPLPEGKAVLSEEEYQQHIARKTELVSVDNDAELGLQTTTQKLRAARDGYRMTEIQIGELATTLKAINVIGVMLEAFLEVTRPIMLRSITIINAQHAGITGANLLAALGFSINETLKICAYGATVMTEQAVALGNAEFLEEGTVDQVKQIQTQNDTVWRTFTEQQYQLVMEKVTPLIEHHPTN